MIEERNKSIDLLRVITMFMILTLHFLGWGGAVNTLTIHDLNYYVIMPIYFIAGMGNTLFFLIAGYFLGLPRLEKAVFLERKTFFYSILLTLAAYLAGVGIVDGWGISYVLKSAFPIIFNKYWFVSVYFILYIFGAVLFKGLKQLSDRMILIVIIALLVNNIFLSNANMDFLQGLLAFIVGYYLRSAQPFKEWSKLKVAIAYIITLMIYAGERVYFQVSETQHSDLDTGLRYILILLLSILFMTFFEKVEIKWEWPSKISKNVIAVYLISTNLAWSHCIYDRTLNISEYCTEWWFVFYYLGLNICIFTICIAIDKVVTILNRKETDLIVNVIRKRVK